MQKIDSVIFDLDGTLWDTSSSCAVAWNNVLKRQRIDFRPITEDDVRRVTGRPHEDCIRETFIGLGETEIQTLIKETAIEDNAVIAKLGGDLYDGVAHGVAELQQKYPLFIVSNCQSGYIETFLEFSGLAKYFKDFECWGNTGKPKAMNLADIIRRNDLKSSIYIGDTEADQIAAKACRVPFYFVQYGFGTVEGADVSFSNFSDLVKHSMLEPLS